MWSMLAPLVVGMVLRRSHGAVQRIVNESKKALGLISTICILLVVWVMVSGARSKLDQLPGYDLWVCGLLSVCIHVIYRVGSGIVASTIRLLPRDWVTVVLMSSQ